MRSSALNNFVFDASNTREPVFDSGGRELVTVKTLAMWMDTHESTIRDWVLDGKIPYIKIPTGGVRFHLPTIRKWYQPGTVDMQRV